jgi:ubiquinone biosynthesis monooxygenase Coq7
MASMLRTHTPLDRLLAGLDTALASVAGGFEATRPTPRPRPGTDTRAQLSPEARTQSERLMRVNHSGEVAAQALYQGQKLTARNEGIRDKLQQAAIEEQDHLAWCAERIAQLGGRRSLLDPFWYGGAFAIGALAGLIGDRVSLGFLAETERQVVAHLDDHLARLSEGDTESRAIIEQMKVDEAGHATTAVTAGAVELPAPVKTLMKLTARVMTGTAYWL